MIKSIAELTEKELYGKKILLRVDFNVPIENGKISETYRIIAVKETINCLINEGAVIALISHITVLNSFESIVKQIIEVLGIGIIFIPDCVGEIVKKNLDNSKSGQVFLLDNVRKYDGEENNDIEFSKKLAEPFDIYVNDAFAASHRNHASLVAITKFLPSYAGFLLIKEIEKLSSALNMSKDGKTLILGGAKIETKFPVIKNFLDKAENILIGGAVANVFLKAKGIDIKKSLTDDNFLEDAKNLLKEESLIIPEDYVVSGDMILDVGQKTIDKFVKTISESKMVIWNGPLGKAENEEFSNGSRKILEAIVNSGAFSIAGGGDTIAFLEKSGFINKFNYISTGGGAMLQFLAGNKLPGLFVLGYD
ncbi:MAG: phosphoglycerate kinase [Candidatus Azambacteria bacterium]|nr:phosphoglycerate kinase [Candidatus Azambacteria bacterium]